MKFSEYINSHHVFKVDELLSSSDSSSAALVQLRRAIKSGKVERIRHGLYASMTGKFQDTVPDSYEVIAAIDTDAPVCYHSALDVLGVAHNISFQREFYTDKLKSAFEYRGIKYVPFPTKPGTLIRKISNGASGRVCTTTKEQTLCDCLSRPDRAGGLEEVIRSVSAMAYLDCDVVLNVAIKLSKTDIARIGWLLAEKSDDWRVSPSILNEMRSLLGKGPYLLGSSKSGNKGWSPEWRLIFPNSIEEVQSWIM